MSRLDAQVDACNTGIFGAYAKVTSSQVTAPWLVGSSGAPGCLLDTEGAVEPPIPTPEELRSLREVVALERVFLR